MKGYTKIIEVDAAGVGVIGEEAFSGCNKMELLKTPLVMEIKKQALYNCSVLKVLPSSDVETIGEQACYECSKMGTTGPLTKLRSLGSKGFQLAGRSRDTVATQPLRIKVSHPLVMAGPSALDSAKFLEEIDAPEIVSATNPVSLPTLYLCERLKTINISLAKYTTTESGEWCYLSQLQGIEEGPVIERGGSADRKLIDLSNITALNQYALRNIKASKMTIRACKVASVGDRAIENSEYGTLWTPRVTTFQNDTYQTTSTKIGMLCIGKNCTNHANALSGMQHGECHLILPSDWVLTAGNAISGKTWNTKEWKSITTDYTQQRLIDFTYEEIKQLRDFLDDVSGATKPAQ